MLAPVTFQEVFSDVTRGDQAAFEFCAAYLRWVNLIDDFADRDKPVEAAEAAEILLRAALTFACNDFWQRHKAALAPLVISGALAWVESEKWQSRPDFRDRASADVLKSQYQEIFWYVAGLCGGYEHMAEMSRKYRSYDYSATG